MNSAFEERNCSINIRTPSNSFLWVCIFIDQVDVNVNPHLPSEYINYLENPMEIINEAEKAAEKDIWNMMQFTETLRCQYGKEPYSMEILLKKLYVRRMAADLGISRIYASGKMVVMETNMSKKVFKLITDSVVSDVHRNSLVYEGNQIKVIYFVSPIWMGYHSLNFSLPLSRACSINHIYNIVSIFLCCRLNFF